MELRGFEPLTSACASTSRLDGAAASTRRYCRGRTPGSGLRPALLPCPTRAKRLERLAGLDENRGLAGRRLIAPDDHVDVERIELDAATDASGLFGGDESRARPKEGVDDDIAAVGEVEERVLEHCGWLHCRMVLKTTASIGAKGRGSRIGPDIRAPATAFAELNVVDVLGYALLEQRQEFVLRAVEAPHAGVGLRPDDEVEGFEAELRRGRVDRWLSLASR